MDGKKKNSVRMEIAFLLCMCALNAHKTGSTMDVVLCVLTFLWMLFSLSLEMRNTRFVIPCSKSLVHYTLFILLYYSSCLWTRSITDTLSYSSYLIQLMGFVFTLNYLIRTDEDVNKYMELILLSLIYMIIMLVLKTPISTWGSERVGGAIGLNENDLGVRCAIGVLLSFYFVKKKPIIYKISLGVFFVVALLSGSRKAMIMVFAVFLLFYVWQEHGFKAFRNAVIAIIFISVIFYVIMNNQMLYAVLGYRVQVMLNKFNLGSKVKSIGYTINSYSIEERTELRNYAFNMFLEHPILGWGGDGFRTHMQQTGLARATYSHCNYTELLATLGIVGFVLYYSYELLILLKGVKGFSRTRDRGMLLVLVFVAINMFAEFFYVSYYSPIIQVVLLLMDCYVNFNMLQKKNGA